MAEVAALGLKVEGAEGIDKASSALDKLADAGRQAEASADRLADAFRTLSGGQQQLLDALNRLDTRLVGIAADMTRTATASETTAQAIVRAGRPVDAFTTSLGHADRALQRFIERQTGVARATRMWEGPLADMSAELDRLRAKYNPLFAASKQYEAELDELNRAHRIGAINAQEYAGALDMLNARFRQTAVASNSAQVNYQHLGNSMSGLAAQFQDIGVTAAMGMNPILIGLQQGTQIAGQMEMAMSRGASATGVFVTAVRSLLGPVTAVSIGLTVLASALIQAVDWAEVGKTTLNALADAIEVIAPYATVAAAALATLYAPTILAGIWSLTKALVGAGQAALTAAAAFAMANPAVIVVAGFAAAVTALYVFRDAVKDAIGIDVIGYIKTGANFVINSFRAAFEDVKVVWNNFGPVMGAAVIGGVNIAIRAINGLIQGAVNGVNDLIEAINKIPGIEIGAIGDSVGISEINNPYKDMVSEVIAQRNEAISRIMGEDPIGALITGSIEAGRSAADWLRSLTSGSDDETASKAKDPGAEYIKQLKERTALLGKETETEQLLARIRVGAINFRTGAMEREALEAAKLFDQRSAEIEQEKILRDLRAQQSVTQMQFMRELESFGQSDRVRELNADLARVEDRYRDLIEARRNSAHGLSDTELAEIQRSLDFELQMVRDHYDRILEIQGDWTVGANRAWENYVEQAQNAAAQAENAMSSWLQGTEDALVNFVQTGKLSFSDLANSIIADMARIAARQTVAGLFGTLGSIGGEGLATRVAVPAGQGGGMFAGIMRSIGSIFGFAKGGVFDSPSLSAYSGGIYSTPQLFAFAKGAGVFGEAGPEAIMPLKRGPDGSLGVRAELPSSANAANAAEREPRVINFSPIIRIDGSTDPSRLYQIAYAAMQQAKVELVDEMNRGLI